MEGKTIGSNEYLKALERKKFAESDIQSLLVTLAEGADPLRVRRGLQIRGFRSKIDNQILAYQLFIPEAHPEGAPLPLVIQPSTVVQRDVPYVEGPVIGDPGAGYLMDKFGYAMLWVGYRSQPYGSPLDFAHLDEVVKALSADFDIDPERLALLGNLLTQSEPAHGHHRPASQRDLSEGQGTLRSHAARLAGVRSQHAA